MRIKKFTLLAVNTTVEPRVRGYADHLSRLLPINVYYDPQNKGYDENSPEYYLNGFISEDGNRIVLNLSDEDANKTKKVTINFSSLTPRKWKEYTQSRRSLLGTENESVVHDAHLELAREIMGIFKDLGFQFHDESQALNVVCLQFISVIREHKDRRAANNPASPDPKL